MNSLQGGGGKTSLLNGFTLAEFFSRHSDGQRRSAFTLAEVLITLGIIGVVAAMTMPSLVAKYQEKATVTKLQKVYSVLQNAFIMVKAQEHSGENMDGWANPGDLAVELAKYLSVAKFCEMGKADECISNSCKNLNGTTTNITWDNKGEGIVLNDGTQMLIYNYQNSTRDYGHYAQIFVDINGSSKQPNTLGKDIFTFYVEKDRINPRGTSEIKEDGSEQTTYCDVSGYDGTAHNGAGCTAHVIFEGNMDYLK